MTFVILDVSFLLGTSLKGGMWKVEMSEMKKEWKEIEKFFGVLVNLEKEWVCLKWLVIFQRCLEIAESIQNMISYGSKLNSCNLSPNIYSTLPLESHWNSLEAFTKWKFVSMWTKSSFCSFLKVTLQIWQRKSRFLWKLKNFYVNKFHAAFERKVETILIAMKWKNWHHGKHKASVHIFT